MVVLPSFLLSSRQSSTW